MKKLWLVALLLLPAVLPAQDVFEEVVENDTKSYFTQIDSATLGPVEERKVPDSIVKRFQNDAAFWYANRIISREKPEEGFFMKLLKQGWFRSLLWLVICLAFGAVLIWFLATSNIRLFRKPPEPIQEFSENISTENIFSIDYDREIEKATRQGAFRLATRLHYLQLLSVLSAKELIRYQQDATNSDYLFQLSGTSYYKPFFVLTRHFEYIWYGQFELTPASFAAVQNDFQTFKKELAI